MNSCSLFIPRPTSDAVTSINEQVIAWIGAQGGELLQTNVWGRRKLAFAIDKHSEGSYVVMNLRLAGATLAEVERNIRLHERILRYIFVRQGE
ncbi:MAG: 30S ribosomal protein S6 [Anaerolineae bacterium]